MFAAGVATRPAGLAFRASPASARIAPALPGSSSPRGRALVVRAGKNQKVKKMKASKVNKKRQEFIEADNEKDQLAAQMRAAARAYSPPASGAGKGRTDKRQGTIRKVEHPLALMRTLAMLWIVRERARSSTYVQRRTKTHEQTTHGLRAAV